MLIVNEIFTSIDGEVNKWGQGRISTFIRLQGCNMRCDYCDTPQALDSALQSKDSYMTPRYIINSYLPQGCKKVTITGGEPLLQSDIWEFIDLLLYYKYDISIETNGTGHIPTKYLDGEVCWVVDFKMEAKERMIVNWDKLTNTDYIKFLVTKGNIDEVAKQIRNLQSYSNARIAVGTLNNENQNWLVDFIKKNRMYDVIVNAQLHKLIGVE